VNVANINLPRILRVGAGASQQVAATLVDLNLSRPLLVTDPYMVQCGYSRRLEEQLEAGGFDYGVFAECVPDPTTDSVYAALKVLREGEYDCVVALGGGSSMDTAKAAAVLVHRDGPMRQYKVPYLVDGGVPIIAIPTTAGTGSEATRVAVISDTETQEKMLCMGMGLMPMAALVDIASYWVHGFFRENEIADVAPGNHAVVTLMTYPDTPLEGRVESLGWGIAQTDGAPGTDLLPSISPTFEWIRLAQRIPVRVHLTDVPDEIQLRVGTTCSVLVTADETGRVPATPAALQ